MSKSREPGDLLPSRPVYFEPSGEEIRSVSEGEPMGIYTVTAPNPNIPQKIALADQGERVLDAWARAVWEGRETELDEPWPRSEVEDTDPYDGKWLW